MIKQGGGGRIINITSVHEDWPMPGNTAYCLSKGGVRTWCGVKRMRAFQIGETAGWALGIWR